MTGICLAPSCVESVCRCTGWRGVCKSLREASALLHHYLREPLREMAFQNQSLSFLKSTPILSEVGPSNP